MQKKNLKLVDVTMVPRIAEVADGLFETYVRDWARVVEWRRDGNVGYPKGGVGGGGSSELNGLPMCGARYLDVERVLGGSKMLRSVLEGMYLGSGMTVQRCAQERVGSFDRWTAGMMVRAYVDCYHRWRRTSARDLGLWDLAADRLDAYLVDVQPAKRVTSARAQVMEMALVNRATLADRRAAGVEL
jgi:hypothetical protein